jgi:predicted dehydrogenase
VSDPEFFYKAGSGPLFDMGPYYLTALIFLLGGISRVTSSAVIPFPTREITSAPKSGTMIKVETPTHIAGVLDFASGVVATLVTSFDVEGEMELPFIEIYGTRGTLRIPDPNGFGGEVMIRYAGKKDWEKVPLSFAYNDNERGIGVVDLARAIQEDRPHRADGHMAYHVLEAMQGLLDASTEGRHIVLSEFDARPEPMPQAGF